MQKTHLFNNPVRLLAPMEGLTDPLMRRVLTQIAYDLGSPYDWAVSEFIRVTHYPLPAHVFYKYVPELHTKGCTASGTPVHVQLLGNNPKPWQPVLWWRLVWGLKPLTLTLVVLPKP